MKSWLLFCLLLLPSTVVSALPNDQCGEQKKECASCHSLSTKDAGVILGDMGEVKEVKVSPVHGLFELTVQNKGQRAVVYLDFSKKYLIAGPIFDIKTKKVLVEQTAKTPPVGKVSVERIPVDNSIVMGNAEGKKQIFVFTDPDCPYCAKLHHELVKLMYMEPNLKILIKLYPLPMHPRAYDKARVILGAENPLFMLDKAFAGEQLPPPEPNDPARPIDETHTVAETFGITATPTVVLPDGRVMVGYRTAQDLKKLLSEENKAQ